MTETTLVSNAELFARAKELFPGGVNSPVRAYGSVGGTPRFIESAAGAFVFDVEGTRFIDYISSWGAIILGHADSRVVTAIQAAAQEGTSYGAPTPGEIELAEQIRKAMPSIDQLRFTSSGTEAVMSAVRLARAFTRRDKVVKFAGCYHGHADALLADAGSGVATLGLPGSAGVTAGATWDTMVVPYNDLGAVAEVFAACPEQIAAVLVEPIAANMGLVLPDVGFLEGLRDITCKDDALLIFDEVISGFRVGLGGAQGHYGIAPDITCLGKVIGGGLPVGAFGGRQDIMEQVAPAGPMYQAGTLSGNPLAMAAGSAALTALADQDAYEILEERACGLASGLTEIIDNSADADEMSLVQLGSLLTLFMIPDAPTNYEQAKAANDERFGRFFHAMLDRGVMLPPSPFEAWFLTLEHDASEIDATLAAAEEVLS